MYLTSSLLALGRGLFANVALFDGCLSNVLMCSTGLELVQISEGLGATNTPASTVLSCGFWAAGVILVTFVNAAYLFQYRSSRIRWQRQINLLDNNLCYMVGIGLPITIPFLILPGIFATAIFTCVLPLYCIGLLTRPRDKGSYVSLETQYVMRPDHGHEHSRQVLRCNCLFRRNHYFRPWYLADHVAPKLILCIGMRSIRFLSWMGNRIRSLKARAHSCWARSCICLSLRW